MKAQFNIEYFVSIIIFIGFVAYIFFQVLTFTPEYLNEIKNEEARSEAYQISELLINDYGEPIDWDLDTVERVGLSNEIQNKTNLLSIEKIRLIGTRCSEVDGYLDVKNWISTDHDFTILLSDSSVGSILIRCNPSTTAVRTVNVSVSRIVAFDNGNYGELVVEVW